MIHAEPKQTHVLQRYRAYSSSYYYTTVAECPVAALINPVDQLPQWSESLTDYAER